MTYHNDITVEEDFDDMEDINFSELSTLDLTTIDENVSYNIFEDNFPQCTITRLGDKLLIRIEEHIYTKYWFHKYHASVFATAMMKAIKRLRLEGVPFSDEELDEDDEVHVFIRWTLTEPSIISSKTLSENINLAFDSVFERANSMLENSDSVLILGKDTGEGLDLLKHIQTHLDNLGFYTYIIKEQPDIIGESVMQKVLRFGLSSRFVIIENSEPTGHLYEFPHITKFAELTSIVLQRQGEGSTWMFEDLYHRLRNIKKFEYTNDTLEEQINIGIEWANTYLGSFSKFQKDRLPWFK
ncbi:hypothetical protein LZF95_00025 [Algoriphagus sp. AGSA1]|uniref:hypothetical protein n=1 Tax=Algoriphagus sp. AGSA1 TaxID=2907213 RepID=UPI001F22F43D|nr:hypothetical protein [Algoriphagus sp. AGSA1]MCE7053040.1 hypothetical protein [Algoriphagus sp. AGSA1]